MGPFSAIITVATMPSDCAATPLMSSSPSSEVGQRGATRHQDDAPGPVGLELGALEHLRAVCGGLLNQRPLVAHLADDDEATRPALDDRGQRQLHQPGPVLTDRARLQLQLLGTAEHLRNPDRLARELMGDLRGIDGDLMKPQQQGQALQPSIRFGSLQHAHYPRSIRDPYNVVVR